jgi:Domain of unknown function (DUF4062)
MSAFISSNSKKAFISSTSEDLGEYRQAASEVCTRLSILPIGMEQFESMGAGATVGSKHKLDEADVYLGIVANRYGYIEDGYDKSVTELEFDHAGARGIERLCFVADEAAPLRKYPEDQVKQAAFRARVDKLIRNTFSAPWEFKYKLYDSVLKWLFRQRGAGPLLRRAFEPLFDDYARFGGRADVLDRVRAFIDRPEPGYLVITGPAGYGKTALATKLVALYPEITAYHFLTRLYGSDVGLELLSEQFFLRNTVEQMRLWDYSPYVAWETPTTLSGWVAAYHDLLARQLPEKRLLMIDGLDEVKAWSLRPYLTATLSGHLKIIVTLRDVGGERLAEYGFPQAQTQHIALGGLSRADVADVLRVAGPLAATIAGNSALLDKLVKVTTPANTVAGCDPLYVTLLADDIEGRRVTAETLDKQAPGLEEYLKKWWEAIVAQSGQDSAAMDLLGTLAACIGPIRREDLTVIHPGLQRSWTADPIGQVIGSMRRTIAGNEAAGYSFAHPRFRDYLRQFPEVEGYEEKLLGYCRNWRSHKGRYALTYTVQHLAAAREYDKLITTVLDVDFHTAQREAFGSVRPTLADCALATEIACNEDRFLDTLKCVATYRRLAHSEGLARAIFKDTADGRFDAAARKAGESGLGVKTSSSWALALRCFLVWAAARANDGQAAAGLVEEFGHQFGLSYHGVASYASGLCDALIANAIAIDPLLAGLFGIGADWAPAVLVRLTPPALDPAALAARRQELEARVQLSETMFGENSNPSAVEFIDEERSVEYTTRLQDALIALANDFSVRGAIDRLFATVEAHRYPRYRDNALVVLAIAALAVPDPNWSSSRLQKIIEIGLEREGVTFTFDLPAQLAAEADRRGLAAPGLTDYLAQATNASDRWGSRLRATSAQAKANYVQGRQQQAVEMLQRAAQFDQGFAGYMSAHLLTVASRWCELGMGERVGQLHLVAQARSHAALVRDPRFGQERQELINRFEQWLATLAPGWGEASAMLRATPDADTRRAYKDLVSANWSAERRWGDWGALLVAALADATAHDFILGRLAGRVIRRHQNGECDFPDAALTEAVTLCANSFATSRPWEMGTPAYA